MNKKVCCERTNKNCALIGLGGAIIGFAGGAIAGFVSGMIAERAARLAAEKFVESLDFDLSDPDDLEALRDLLDPEGKLNDMDFGCDCDLCDDDCPCNGNCSEDCQCDCNQNTESVPGCNCEVCGEDCPCAGACGENCQCGCGTQESVVEDEPVEKPVKKPRAKRTKATAQTEDPDLG